MVAVRELIAAIFLVSPCVRKELPVADPVGRVFRLRD